MSVTFNAALEKENRIAEAYDDDIDNGQFKSRFRTKRDVQKYLYRQLTYKEALALADGRFGGNKNNKLGALKELIRYQKSRSIWSRMFNWVANYRINKALENMSKEVRILFNGKTDSNNFVNNSAANTQYQGEKFTTDKGEVYGYSIALSVDMNEAKVPVVDEHREFSDEFMAFDEKFTAQERKEEAARQAAEPDQDNISVDKHSEYSRDIVEIKVDDEISVDKSEAVDDSLISRQPPVNNK
ncbi:MAG: hypothetical protein ACI4L9_03420 [Candidatus Coproplasma sp.]